MKTEDRAEDRASLSTLLTIKIDRVMKLKRVNGKHFYLACYRHFDSLLMVMCKQFEQPKFEDYKELRSKVDFWYAKSIGANNKTF